MIVPPPPIRVSRDHLCRAHERLTRLGRLPIWVVYRPPTREYPNKWVARCHVTLPADAARPTRWVALHDTLEELREALPPFLYRLERDPSDPPQIVEVWI